MTITTTPDATMHPNNRQKLADRVTGAAETVLAAQGYVAPLDVLVGIGWLNAGAVKRWRQGQVACLEGVVQANLSRISEAMKLFRSWANDNGLLASETAYVARTPHGRRLSSAGAETRRSNGSIAPIGCRPSFPSAAVNI